MPGNNGGANFSGAAVDPEHGTMFVVSKDFPAMLKLSLTGPDTGDPATMRYKSAFGFMVTSNGLSAIKPPWTTFTAYDLNTGTIKWQIPLGEGSGAGGEGNHGYGLAFPESRAGGYSGRIDFYGDARPRYSRARCRYRQGTLARRSGRGGGRDSRCLRDRREAVHCLLRRRARNNAYARDTGASCGEYAGCRCVRGFCITCRHEIDLTM